jgi:hypothetical protein
VRQACGSGERKTAEKRRSKKKKWRGAAKKNGAATVRMGRQKRGAAKGKKTVWQVCESGERKRRRRKRKSGGREAHQKEKKTRACSPANWEKEKNAASARPRLSAMVCEIVAEATYSIPDKLHFQRKYIDIIIKYENGFII